jgi:hypothetical protein
MQRQRVLERAGWVFWRCFASAFIRRRRAVVEDLLRTLVERGIEPIGGEGSPMSVHTEHRIVHAAMEPTETTDLGADKVQDTSEKLNGSATPDEIRVVEEVFPPNNFSEHLQERRVDLLFDDELESSPSVQFDKMYPAIGSYTEYTGPKMQDPRQVGPSVVAEGLIRIIEVEGPIIAKRAYDIYLRDCGIKRMGHELKKMMNKALSNALRQGRVVSENEGGKDGLLFSVIRTKDSPPIRLRRRGPRAFEEIPPSELQVVARYMAEQHGYTFGTDEHLRTILDCFELKRLTTQVGTTLLEIFENKLPHVQEYLQRMDKS